MSGRSGYGRSKIVGKLIHLPANMMMAGLAPRVGKPGWAIRLYWRRVDECFCVYCPPIRIIRRFFSPGNVIDTQLTSNGITVHTSIGAGIPSGTQMYYGIVFDRAIKSPQATPVSGGPGIGLATPDSMNWTTGTSGSTFTLMTIPTPAIQQLSTSGQLGGLTTGLNIDIGNGVVGTGSGLTQWAEINTTSASLQDVEFAPGGVVAPMAYIITDPTLVGGYAMLFNVTRLFLSSASGPVTGGLGEIDALTAGQLTTYTPNLFRQNLAIAAGFTATTIANPTNNISTTFTPPTSTVTFTTDECPPENGGGTTFNAPVGGFAIAAGNGQPVLELLP